MDLKISHDVIIENVHLSDSLMVLGYRLKEKLRKDALAEAKNNNKRGSKAPFKLYLNF